MTEASTTDFAQRQELDGYAHSYHLLAPERQRASHHGELAGRATGSSIEFQDRKDYVVGDDLRHIDWRAYARNDRLTLKLYREEISPLVDLVIDGSASMNVTAPKRQRSLQLAYLFYRLGQKMRGLCRLYALGQRLERAGDPLALLALEPAPIDDPTPLLRGAPPTRRGGVKIIISDLLFPVEPATLCAMFGAADRLVIIQTLSDFEAAPELDQTVRLEDAETSEWIDLRLDRATVEGYLRRLAALREDYARQAHRAGGVFVSIDTHQPLAHTIEALVKSSAISI